MVQILKTSDVRSNLSQLLNRVFRGETDVIVEKSGIPVAAIVSTQDYEKLQQIKKARERDFAVISEIRTAFSNQKPEEIEKKVNDAILQVRKEQKDWNNSK